MPALAVTLVRPKPARSSALAGRAGAGRAGAATTRVLRCGWSTNRLCPTPFRVITRSPVSTFPVGLRRGGASDKRR
jgi:hypothetical protein